MCPNCEMQKLDTGWIKLNSWSFAKDLFLQPSAVQFSSSGTRLLVFLNRKVVIPQTGLASAQDPILDAMGSAIQIQQCWKTCRNSSFSKWRSRHSPLAVGYLLLSMDPFRTRCHKIPGVGTLRVQDACETFRSRTFCSECFCWRGLWLEDGAYLFLVHEARDLKHVVLRTPWIDTVFPSTESISFYRDI